MSLTSRSLLTTMISLALYGPSVAYANTLNTTEPTHAEQMVTASPKPTHAPEVCIPPNQKQEDINNLPITIKANDAVGVNNKTITYSGDVTVKQGYRTISANKAVFDQPKNTVTATGDVYVDEGSLAVHAQSMQSNMTTRNAEMNQAHYNLVCSPGRGQAAQIRKYNVDGTQFYEMKDGTYTTCPENDKSWRFAATTLKRKGDSPFADLYNATFQVHDVPVFYIPYLRVPVEKERLTGFLYPSIGMSTRDGFELSAPFYWNIAPNYDLIFTPKLMTNRGVELSSRFRYLNAFGEGSFRAEYLPHDKKYPNDGARWAYNWTHNGIYDQNWLFNVDYSRASGPNYFNQIDSKIGNREDNNLMQTGSVSYRNQNWDSTLMVRNFQPLQTSPSSNYRLLPQLTVNYYQPDLPYNFDFNMKGQFSRFTNENPDKPSADRFYLAPSLTLPYSTPWFSLITQTKLMYTHYNQRFDRQDMLESAGSNQEEKDAINKLKHSDNRLVPSLRIHGSMYFERNTDLFGQDYTQTLEPQIQYLYIRKTNQTGIYNPVNITGGGYDTTRMQQDYYGLFSDRQYSSIDYIAPANQFTIGATTRYFDSNYKERFNLSVGQIFYINKENTNGKEVNYSATALNSEFNISDHWLFKTSMQYDASQHEMQIANGAFEYQNNGIYLQPSYHYVSNNYLTEYGGDNPNRFNSSRGEKDGISQVGLSVGVPIYGDLSATGDYYFDTNTHKMIESQVGFTYRSSCWSISLGMNRYASTSLGNDNTQYENNFGLSFSLLGLKGAQPLGYNTSSENALSYGNTFTLNN